MSEHVSMLATYGSYFIYDLFALMQATAKKQGIMLIILFCNNACRINLKIPRDCQ